MPAWRSNLQRTRDLRRHPRHSTEGTIRILWEDSAGRERISDARLLNVSTAGIKVRVKEKIPVRSFVVCNDLKLKISGRGSVRYCIEAKGAFEAGIEFTGGTGWSGAEPN